MQKVLPRDPKKVYIDVRHLKVVAVVLLLTGVFIPFSRTSIAKKHEREVCRNYQTQIEAQIAFTKGMKDPSQAKYFKRMDGDHDRIACEHLPLE